MAHLASFLKKRGSVVRGCDTDTDFYTSKLLQDIEVFSFSSYLPISTECVIYSAAYNDKNIRVIEDAKEANLPFFSYPEFLAYLSRKIKTYAITGTHGKSTTTALTSYILSESGFKGASIYGSFITGENSAYYKGDEALVIEGCEYRNHFHLYKLSGIVILNIDFDHPDFFSDIEAVKNSFKQLIRNLEKDAFVLYNSNCENTISVINELKSERIDLDYIPFNEKTLTKLSFDTSKLSSELISDYNAAIMLSEKIYPNISCNLDSFSGLAARREEVSLYNGIVFLDDYAHHPAEIKATINSIRKAYKGKRIVTIFMPHTASRTKALLKDFAKALSLSNCVIVQTTFSSARNDKSSVDYAKKLSRELDKILFRTFSGTLSISSFAKDSEEAVAIASALLQSGDVCITMGAGDNRKLIDQIRDRIL